MIGPDQMIGSGLRRGIRTIRLIACFLAKRSVVRSERTVNFIRGYVQEPKVLLLRTRHVGPIGSHFLEQIECSVHIRFYEIVWSTNRSVDMCLSSEVDNPSGPALA